MNIVQFGEGNFLRAFADHYFDCLKREGRSISVTIVKPISFGSLAQFAAQDNRYHVVLRGMENGKRVESVQEIGVVSAAVDPFCEWERYLALAEDPELKVIVSNTTEAGIRFDEKDAFEEELNNTYPAKLTKFLYRRFRALGGSANSGVYLLPVELIDDNAARLFACVEDYIRLWNLPEDFAEWNRTCNYYCATLVDRIVTGYPKEDVEAVEKLIGEPDKLVTVGEPFGLWVVEKKGEIESLLPAGKHGVNVVFAEDIGFYKKRKVRILNGAHTTLVPLGMRLGVETVGAFVSDELLSAFLDRVIHGEIVPNAGGNVGELRAYANEILDRFSNPFLKHRLASISLNSVSKWRARVLPSVKDCIKNTGRAPRGLMIGFACLLSNYMTGRVPLADEERVLAFFAKKPSLAEVLANEELWGEDLRFLQSDVQALIERIESGKEKEAVEEYVRA